MNNWVLHLLSLFVALHNHNSRILCYRAMSSPQCRLATDLAQPEQDEPQTQSFLCRWHLFLYRSFPLKKMTSCSWSQFIKRCFQLQALAIWAELQGCSSKRISGYSPSILMYISPTITDWVIKTPTKNRNTKLPVSICIKPVHHSGTIKIFGPNPPCPLHISNALRVKGWVRAAFRLYINNACPSVGREGAGRTNGSTLG